jgi:hypothetical protein
VADHIVHRRIQHETIAILALARGSGLEIVDDEPLDHFIDLKRREAGERAPIQQPEHGRQQPAGFGQQGQFLRLLRHASLTASG